MRYLNIKTAYGVETIDQIRESDYKTRKEYIKELRTMREGYRMSGANIYTSRRCTKAWKNSQ